MAAQGATVTAPPQCPCIGDLRALQRDVHWSNERVHGVDRRGDQDRMRVQEIEMARNTLAWHAAHAGGLVAFAAAIGLPLSLAIPGVRRSFFSWLSHCRAGGGAHPPPKGQ